MIDVFIVFYDTKSKIKMSSAEIFNCFCHSCNNFDFCSFFQLWANWQLANMDLKIEKCFCIRLERMVSKCLVSHCKWLRMKITSPEEGYFHFIKTNFCLWRFARKKPQLTKLVYNIVRKSIENPLFYSSLCTVL